MTYPPHYLHVNKRVQLHRPLCLEGKQIRMSTGLFGLQALPVSFQ